MKKAAELYARLRDEVQQVVVGHETTLEFLLAALLARGHVLLEGVPGVAKTLTVRVLSGSLGLKFSRIQFTPDLMPSDLTGTNVFNMKDQSFEFLPGPLFASVVLADEINRAPARTQAALLQAMEERQITIDRDTHRLSGEFMVLATQNPVEFEGTYRLPEAELDRFMARLVFDYPEESDEEKILARADSGRLSFTESPAVEHVGPSGLGDARSEAEAVTIDKSVLRYISALVRQTRRMEEIQLGCSPRAGVQLLRLSKAVAAVRDLDYLTPDLVQECAATCLPHRWILKAEAEIQGTQIEAILTRLFQQVRPE